MWRNKLRLLVILGVAALFVLLGLEFKSVPITDRAFVLGMGIDYTGNAYELTCEILVPAKYAGGGSANEESHKILTGTGADIAHALNDIFKKTGKLPSLGHCSVLILGESVYTRGVLKELDFFLKSDSFRASTAVAATEGTAKDLMNTKTPLEKFTSLSLFEITSVYGSNTGTEATTLGEFRAKMLSDSAAAYLTLVTAIPEPETQGGEDADTTAGEAAGQPLVFYDCTRLAAFNAGGFSGLLTTEEADGLRLLAKNNNHENFRVRDENGNYLTVSLASKHVKTCLTLGSAPQIVYEIDIKLKPAEAEDLNTAEGFMVSSAITEFMREDVRRQIEEKVTAARSKALLLNSDILELSNKFYAVYGTSWSSYAADNTDYLSKTNFAVKINVQ